MRFPIRWLLRAALIVLPAPAALAYTAHYFVINENATTGALSVIHHRLVELDGSPEGAASRERASVHESRLEARILDKSTGGARFDTMVTGSPWLRGEFHGADSRIDGHVFPLEERTYVVRVPAEAAAVLRLRGLDAGTGASLAPAPELIIDLDAAAASMATSPALKIALPAGWDTGSILNNGSPANRLDLLIVAEGYTAAQKAKFITDATALTNGFFSESPYSVFKQLINVNYLFVPSNQEGADHPACADPDRPAGDPVYTRDTAFDATYCTNTIWRLLTVNTNKVTTAAGNVANWDKLLVLVNDTTYGGAGGFAAVASTDAASVEVMRHEFGHQFSLLDDEYDFDYPAFPACSDAGGGSPCGPNTTDITNKPQIKWAGWMLPATVTPTVGPLADPLGAGAWQGARYRAAGMYRQCFNGKMKSLNAPFCHVDSEVFVKRLYAGWNSGAPATGVSNIEPGATPAAASVNVPVNTAVTFSATVVGSTGAGALKVEWIVDASPPVVSFASHNSVQTFMYTVPNTNTHTVTLRVSDTTGLLLQPNVRTQSWTVKGTAPVPNITLDVTGDGTADALTDGIIIIRYLFSITSDSMIAGALGNNPGRTTTAAVLNYLNTIRPQLDVDGDTKFEALNDGILIIRYLFGIQDDRMIANAVGATATRKTAADIAAYLAPMAAPH